MTTMGRRIAARRHELGLTQAELADKLGLSRQTVSMWESGTIQELRGRHLTILAQVLEVSDEWIVFGEERREIAAAADDDLLAELLRLVRRLPREDQQEILEQVRQRDSRARELYEELRKRYG